jgi:hypothetical protein
MIPFVLFLISGIFLIWKRNFDFWNIPSMGSIFEDLQTLTFNVTCDTSSQNWQPEVSGCDPFSRPINYPSIWLFLFRLFNLDDSKTFLLGTLMFLLTATSILFWARIATSSGNLMFNSVFFSIIVCSPPIMLLVERGNIDSIIFAGLTLVSFLIIREQGKLSFLILAGLSFLKIFPLGGVLLFIKKVPLKYVIGFISVFSLFWVINLQELMSIRKNTPYIDNVSYGVSVPLISIAKQAGLPITDFVSYLLSLLLFVSLVLCFFLLFSKSSIFSSFVRNFYSNLSSLGWKARLFELNSGVFVFSFLLGTNFAYRLIFLVPILAIFISLPRKRLISKVILTSLILAFFTIMGNAYYALISNAILFWFASFLLFFIFWSKHTPLRGKVKIKRKFK